MIKNTIHFELKIGDRSYNFFCSPDSPLGEIHDALFTMKSEILKKINELDKAQEENQADEKVE